MNKRQLQALVAVNLLYVNPQTTNNARKKGRTGAKLSRYLINQYLLSGVLFLVIYGLTMVLMDFSQMPGFFTYYVALFGILGFSQGISVIYNVFFENQDVSWYLPLPFAQAEIFSAKFLVIAMTIVPFVLPMLVLLILTSFRSGVFLPWAIFSALLLFGLFLILIFCVCSGIVFGMTRTKLFKKHKKGVTSLLLVLSMVVSVGGILIMSFQQPSAGAQNFDRSTISFLLPFFYAAAQPFSKYGLLSLAGLLLLSLACIALIGKTLVPRFLEQLLSVSSIPVGNRKHKNHQSLHQLLRNYNSQLVREPTLIMQVFSSSLIMPITFLISFSVSSELDMRHISPQFSGLAFFIGVAVAALITTPMSFIAILISLDKENFAFVRALPIAMRTYLKEKFNFALQIQIILVLSLVLLAGLVWHLPWYLLVAAFLGGSIASYLLGLRYFSRDYRLLELHWTDYNQLYNRGSGRWGTVFLMFGVMILGGILLTVYGFAEVALSFWMLDLPLFIFFALVTFFSIRHYQKSFWEKV